MKKRNNNSLYQRLVAATNKSEVNWILSHYGITLKDLTAIQIQLLNKH